LLKYRGRIRSKSTCRIIRIPDIVKVHKEKLKMYVSRLLESLRLR